MEAIRGYIPKIKVPSFAQLRDGSFLTRAIEKYEAEAQHSLIRDLEVGPELEISMINFVGSEQTGESPGGGCLVQPHS